MIHLLLFWYFLPFGMENVEKIEDFIIHFLLLTIKVDQVGWIYLLFSSCDYNEFQFLIVLYLHSCSKRRFFLLISLKSSDFFSGKVCTIYKPNYKWKKKKKFNVGVWEDDEFKNKEENLMDFWVVYQYCIHNSRANNLSRPILLAKKLHPYGIAWIRPFYHKIICIWW